LLTIVTWLWGDKYPPEYVRKLRAGLERNLKQPFRFLVIKDGADEELRKGCLCRLKMFDIEWQIHHAIERGDRIVNIDIDCIITGPLDDLFDRSDFTILSHINSTNPCPYNGSLFMWMAGDHTDVWRDFSLEKVRQVPYYAFPDDQGWLWHKFPQAGEFGPASGVYAFKKRGWPSGDALPEGARVVAFPGWRGTPHFFEQFQRIDWIKEHWC
jgi:hypothetical protein